ncbi:MAG: bifunctional UDP-N-acetylglucosamine pyrophosphorylase / glucosamine-phosphate N-acetyltransferase [Candidatus Binatota bacterium]|nr:bifunctional UDP-N-acetylglucosamine pyrophosphorylase / glucosamine-phosphate N-acetyltransferase [Candidatus Binatota bacterium]
MSSRSEIVERWIASGVRFDDPATAYVEDGVVIGAGTVVGPNVQLRGKTAVGRDCRIDGTAYLVDSRIGDRTHLRFGVVISESEVAEDVQIGPFAHLRPGTVLGPRVHIGNFVETKKARIGEGTKANHLTYLGDVTIGRDTNVGAGTITCNYDGFEKHPTEIGDRVQVGSDTTLVAPLKLEDDVYVATATTVRHDVPAGALVYNERRERVRPGWTAEKRRKMGKAKGS